MENTQYYCYLNGEQRGPMPVEELKALNIKRETLVWREGLENWVSAGALSELSVLFAPAPAPATVAAAPLYTPAPAAAPRPAQANPRRKTFAKTAKVFGIFGIIASGLLLFTGSLMLLERDFYYIDYYYSSGVDEGWSFYYMFFSFFMLASSIVTVASASRTIRRNRAQR